MGVQSYNAPRIKPAQRAQKRSSNAVDPTVQGLKKNLDELTKLQSRLRFMLNELEDLVKA